MFPYPAEAIKFKPGAERQIVLPASQTIVDMLMEWHNQNMRAGQTRPQDRGA